MNLGSRDNICLLSYFYNCQRKRNTTIIIIGELNNIVVIKTNISSTHNFQ